MIVGVLGLGRIGATHARNLARVDGVDVVAYDPDAAALARVVEPTGARALPDRDAVLGVADALVIATPTANHPDDLAAGAAAGVPMFCEKPVSLDVASTAAALHVVERAGVELQIGFMRRFDAGFVAMRRAVESGDLGDVYLVRAASHDHVPPHESYLDESGSVYRDMHIHDFDAVRWLTGRDVVEVYAAGSVLVDEMFRRHGDVDMTALVLVLDGGVLASVTGARANPLGYDHRTEVIGSRDALCAGWNERTPLRSADPGAGAGAGDARGPVDRIPRSPTGSARRIAPRSRRSLRWFVEMARTAALPGARSKRFVWRSPPIARWPSTGPWPSARSLDTNRAMLARYVPCSTTSAARTGQRSSRGSSRRSSASSLRTIPPRCRCRVSPGKRA